MNRPMSTVLAALLFFAVVSPATEVQCNKLVQREAIKDLGQDLTKAREFDSNLIPSAISSENETHIRLNSGVLVAGKLKEVIFDEATGLPVYIQTEGPTRMTESGRVLKGQDYNNHIDGFGTGVGPIEAIEIKTAGNVISKLPQLSAATKATIASLGISVGQRLKLTYQSGLVVEGNLVELQYLPNGRLGVMSFQDATATYGSRTLFKPVFGRYDVFIAESVNEIKISTNRAQLDHRYNSKKYKTNVTEIKKNALEFFEDMKSRFAEQKAKDPENPYSFAFPESASIFPYMLAETKNRIHLYTGDKGLYWRYKEEIKRMFNSALKRTEALARQEEKLNTELELLQLLQADLEAVIQRGDSTYEEAIRYSYFFTKAMQMTEDRRRAPVRMIPYEIFMNAKYGTVREELESYKLGRMALTSGRFGFSITGQTIFNPNKLEVVIVPVVGFLLASDLIATRNVPVHYATVASQFARADGFVLRSHTLYLHDIYFHGGLREVHDRDYFKARNMNEADIEVFRNVQQEWITEFLTEFKKITDQKMRTAITKVVQVITHDRGHVFAPSTFNDHYKRNYYYGMKGETYVTIWGQMDHSVGATYPEVLKRMHAAHIWVHNFWLKYKDSPY